MDIISSNTMKAVRFERPQHIPMAFWINPACRHHYCPDVLLELMAEHRILFPGFSPDRRQGAELDPWERAGCPYTDAWGCVWETTDDGITGTVTHHPLFDWDAFEQFSPPDPERTSGMKGIDWTVIAEQIRKEASAGRHCAGGLEHGHTFLRLSYLRGYENLSFDMADGDDRLVRLIQMVEAFNLGIVERYLDAGVEMMRYPEDLGMQRGPMLSPEHFRRYIRPTYERLVALAHDRGCLVHMHSDGDIRELASELAACGVDALNLQDLVNGIDWIRDNLKGRVCIDLDIDRQQITRFGTAKQIDALIREEVEKLGGPEGGLMMIYGLYPGVPLENIQAVMDAMERYSGYYT